MILQGNCFEAIHNVCTKLKELRKNNLGREYDLNKKLLFQAL